MFAWVLKASHFMPGGISEGYITVIFPGIKSTHILLNDIALVNLSRSFKFCVKFQILVFANFAIPSHHPSAN